MEDTTKTAHFSIDSRGFLRVVFLDNQEEFDEEEARIHLYTANKLCAGISMPVLVDTRISRHVPTIEAKKIIATFPKKKAEAILISSLSHRILGNFYLKITQQINPSHPIKLFNDEEEAVNWLIQFLN
jgi:hypothetical protein